MKIEWYDIGLLLLFLFGILAQASQASSLTSTSTYTNPEGLIGYWDMSGNSTSRCSGTQTVDQSDWANTGTLTNSPTWVVGKYGCGINFNGVNQYLINATQTFSAPTTAFTLSAWVNMNELSTHKGIVELKGTSSMIYWYIHNNRPSIYNGSNTIFSSTNINATQWTHIAVTYNGSTAYFYLDGIADGSAAFILNPFPNPATIYIGTYQASSEYMNGTIDEVKIWNRVLSAEEIYVDYLGTYANIEKYYQGLTTSNITNSTGVIIGNMSSNFTTTNLLITYLNGNLSSNFSYSNGLISNVLGNQTLVLGNLTLALGNESTIITNIANLNGNMSANFTYTNGQIALLLGNQTLILGNETLILTNLANVNATQNANYVVLEALINSLSNLTAQEVWEYFNRTANCSNCGNSLTATDVWSYVSRTLTDYNLTGVLSYLEDINATQVLILGNQSFILGNESIIITNIANLNGNMNANFTYIGGRITLVLGNQTFILGNETLILTNLATLGGNMSSNFSYTNSLINNLNCSGGNGTGSTFYYLNQTVQADSNVSGMQQWFNFQILLLIMSIAFLGFGIWRHNNPMISMGSIILILLALSIYSDGINSGVSNITQNGNYTYNGYSQLANITSNDAYSYKTWKDAASNGIALLLAIFGSGLFIYSALYVPFSDRGRK